MEPHFRAAALAAVRTARLRGYIPCIVPQIIYEYWVVATRSVAENGLGLTVADAQHDVTTIVEQFHLFRDERAILERWHQLVLQHAVQGKTAHDVRLVAAMNRHGISHLVTFNDSHFKRFAGITVVHPNNVLSLPST